jgi:hypothetical protein
MEQTPEHHLLEDNPGTRELIESLPEFHAWRSALPVVEVDGDTFWVVGGDQLKDNEQVIVAWMRQFRPDILEGDLRMVRGSPKKTTSKETASVVRDVTEDVPSSPVEETIRVGDTVDVGSREPEPQTRKSPRPTGKARPPRASTRIQIPTVKGDVESPDETEPDSQAAVSADDFDYIEDLGLTPQTPKPTRGPGTGRPSFTRPSWKRNSERLDEVQSGNGPPQVLIDGENFYRHEADLLLDEDQHSVYQDTQKVLQAQREAARSIEEAGFGEVGIKSAGTGTSDLIGIVQDGNLVRWAPGTVLSYCVLRQTFPRDDWYEEVANNMWLAVNDWAATCGVEFEYMELADSSDSLRPPNVLFPVRHLNAGGVFIAASFFPNDPINRRRVLVDPSYHVTTFDHVGVFRHELGHVLGFRHEHISSAAPPICPDEDTTGTLDLTAYDPQSVMHYFCGGVGSRRLAITDVDRTGSQLVYGPPLSAFQLIEA